MFKGGFFRSFKGSFDIISVIEVLIYEVVYQSR